MTLNPYLTFDGNCKDALALYKDALGADVTIQTVGESPMAAQMPEMKDQVMHAVVSLSGTTLFMASDMLGKEATQKGNLITMCINCDSEEQLRGFYAKIVDGGIPGHEPKVEFWGGVYADCEDKFGIRWMFNFQKTAQQ